ncbi:Alpha-L-Rha alpha-1,3-L-rhamnosyltransferase [Methanococcoides methylutens MM1]|uniref:Alpha-L-Rha alpha-1,3-L-rhamnosyltransferase n=2 Tax=Methanococcoides methylutens TaxID=2226 RepID=A0A0E3X178_METMT|nr:Alpha-L-Rha alpha-1,3-L-rhamnosyltransferase [Methanococcoides methylutens MM1]
MKISVALCTYNGSHYLQEQLESIAQQTRLPDELVICDDQSTDNTIEIVKKFATKAHFPVRLIINEKNLGSTKNFEQAIGLCKGDIIALSDQDDVWNPKKLLIMEGIFLTKTNVGAVFTDAELVDKYLNPLGYTLWESIEFTKKEQKRFNNGGSVEVLLKHNVVTGATMAFRSEYRDFVLPISSSWIHDGWIALLIAFKADLVIVPEQLIKYRQHSAQQIGAGSKRDLLITIKERASKLIFGLKIDPNEYLNCFIQYREISAYTNRKLSSINNEKKSYLKSKVEHCYKRVEMPQKRIQRFPIVMNQLIKGNYHRYSYGIYSFVEDLLR